MGTPREAMVTLLKSTRRDFGSMRGYLAAQGASTELFGGYIPHTVEPVVQLRHVQVVIRICPRRACWPLSVGGVSCSGLFSLVAVRRLVFNSAFRNSGPRAFILVIFTDTDILGLAATNGGTK